MSPDKIKLLLNGNKIKNVLNHRVNTIFDRNGQISEVETKPIKIYCDSRSFNLVATYRIVIKDLRGKTSEKILLASAHSSGIKKRDYQIAKLIFKHFSGNISKICQIPKPYLYIKPYGLFLREYIEGKILGEIIKYNKGLSLKIAQLVAGCLSEFQKIKISKSGLWVNKKRDDFSNLEKNIKILQARQHPDIVTLKKALWRMKIEFNSVLKYEKEENYVLSHGDLHPLNIILTSDKKVALLDLENAGYRNCLWDVAGFYSHLGTLTDLKIKKNVRTKSQRLFLNAYLKITKKILTPKKKLLFALYKKYFDMLALTHTLVWGDKRSSLQKIKELRLVS